jgi:hypothetical protein
MLKLSHADLIADDIAGRIGERPTITEHGDHHVLTACGHSVLIAATEGGDWFCKDVSKPHAHQDDNLLREHFLETVASMLLGDRACAACPSDAAGNT